MTVDIRTGEIIEGEVVEDLDAAAARDLTDQIRQTLRVGHDLIIRAYQGRAWLALGYTTWDAYCSGEFSEARMVRLDREQRREIVAKMRQGGLSQAAIASGLNVSPSTIAMDSTAINDGNYPDIEELPERVVGLDGKSRPSRAPRPNSPSVAGAGTIRSPRLRQERADLIRDLAAQGFTSHQMVDQAGVSEGTVRQIARDFDIDIHADRIVGRGGQRIDHTAAVESAVTSLDNWASSLTFIDFAEVDDDAADEWVASLKESRTRLNAFISAIEKRTARAATRAVQTAQ